MPRPDPNPHKLWCQVKTFVFCVPTCVQVCAPLHTCTAVGFRPSDREYTGSFSGPRIAVNGAGWQRGQQPTHSVRGWQGDDYTGSDQWTDSHDVTWAAASREGLCQCFRLKCVSRVFDFGSRPLIEAGRGFSRWSVTKIYQRQPLCLLFWRWGAESCCSPSAIWQWGAD